MLVVLGTVLSLLLVLWSIGHLLFAYYFANGIVTRGIKESQNQDDFCPKASIVISLRGYDPTLRQNLIGLLNQDYDDYEIVIIVDNREDVTWKVVESVKSEFDTAERLRFMALTDPLESCSLKCNSLIQAYASLDQKSEVLVLIDADVIPHGTWLREVVAPLSDPTIGASTGNQWYCPTDESIGSLLRSLWNSVAIVPTAIFANPWAGTCALRIVDVERTGLIDMWKNSAVDDGPIKNALKPIGLRVHFEPRLIMVNSDACTLGYLNQYVTRMLTWSKMYEATFPHTLIHMIIAQSLTVSVIMMLLLAIVFANGLLAGIVIASMILWTIIMLCSYCLVRNGVQKAVKPRNSKLAPLTPFRLAKLFVLVPVCHFLHAFWTMSAVFSKRVSWRDVTYRLKGRDQIEMVDYQPYSSEAEQAPSRVSI